MTEIGMKIRLQRIMNRGTGRTIIVPMDHGITVGPLKGLLDMSATVDAIAKGGANAVLMHKGSIEAGYRGRDEGYIGPGPDIGLICHLNASTSLSPDPNDKVPVTTVQEALDLGADAISVHINVGSTTIAKQLMYLGDTAKTCKMRGMPLIAMMYPRGKHWIGAKAGKPIEEHDVEVVKHAARVGAELGANIIKTNYTGDIDSFKEVIRGCYVPVVVAGGPRKEKEGIEDIFELAYGTIQAGGAGVSIGRNVFQDDNPQKIVKALYGIVNEDLSVEEAMSIYTK